MRVPRLRVQLAAANGVVVLILVVGVTVLLTSRSDQLRRAEATSGAQHDAEVLSTQVGERVGDPATLRNLTAPDRSRRSEVVSTQGVRLAGADLLQDPEVGRVVSADLDDTGIHSTRQLARRARQAIGVDSVVVKGELRGAAVVVEPLAPIRGWRQLYGLDLPVALLLVSVAAAVGWWLAGRISRPLEQLTEQARALVLSGETLPVARSRIPEVATLRAAMGRLADRVSNDVDHRDHVDAHLRRLSHELRTPLTTIRLQVEEQADRSDSAGRHDEAGDVILRQLDRLDLLGQELTQLRLEPRDTSPVDVAAATAQVIDRLRPLATWGDIDLRADLVPGCIVDGDADDLADAVVNVIENAVKYTPGGGRVTVRVAPVDEEVWVEVSDTGPGIAAQLSEALIRPGVRLVGQRPVAGSGQGLAIVAATVDRHGGTLELNSASGGGALVRLRLPATPEGDRR